MAKLSRERKRERGGEGGREGGRGREISKDANCRYSDFSHWCTEILQVHSNLTDNCELHLNEFNKFETSVKLNTTPHSKICYGV